MLRALYHGQQAQRRTFWFDLRGVTCHALRAIETSILIRVRPMMRLERARGRIPKPDSRPDIEKGSCVLFRASVKAGTIASTLFTTFSLHHPPTYSSTISPLYVLSCVRVDYEHCPFANYHIEDPRSIRILGRLRHLGAAAVAFDDTLEMTESLQIRSDLWNDGLCNLYIRSNQNPVCH